MRRLLFIAAIVLLLLAHLQAQVGEITGRVSDDSGEGRPFINVAAEQDGKLIKGVQTDFDGYFTLKLDTGTYDIKVTSTNATMKIIRGVTVFSNKAVAFYISTTEKIEELKNIEVKYNKPVIAKSETAIINTISSGDIVPVIGQGVPQVMEPNKFNSLRRERAGTGMAKTKKFEWDEIMCSYEAVYDSRKLTENRLRNTYSLITVGSPYSLHTPFLFDPEDIDKLNLDSLDKQYRDKLKKLRRVKIVRSRFWKEEKKLRIAKLKEEYEWGKVIIKGFKDPAFLKSYRYADACFEYIDALQQGGEKLLSCWQQLEASICRDQTDQAACYKRLYEDKANTPEKYEHARVNVMTFGWGRCFGRARAADYSGNPRKTDPLEEYKKFFITVTRWCHI